MKMEKMGKTSSAIKKSNIHSRNKSQSTISSDQWLTYSTLSFPHLTSIHWGKCYGKTQLHLIPSLCWGASEFCPWESSVHATIFWNILVLVVFVLSPQDPSGSRDFHCSFHTGLSQWWSFFCLQFMLGNMEFVSLEPPWAPLGHRSESPHCSVDFRTSRFPSLPLRYRV